MNPAMSSWVALRRRVPIEPGQSVLVLGATGNAGAMAVQVAKRLGAGRVVGAGRDAERLAALDWASAPTPSCNSRTTPTRPRRHLAEAAADVDIVIDYLWGEPAAAGHDVSPDGASRPEPSVELDPDRGDGRSDDRASLGRFCARPICASRETVRAPCRPRRTSRNCRH